ncbi:uncharacterized protein LOC108627608 isoform X3 [Ceratina calcarata]|nr:uncharacterized protein LOC108627608 isoform X3 [Ceratina calcarata]XP_026671815.1 uncharacterized protein LOC108627608 isoform X3 [Ceratina calcarata]XP_026671816.1 uncharacterized protein LOC108627608 isoform X3 [Ceratina calcarata]XP_026671817.1 uncharacterized protein LOC108627608 isoform X3 [Ceratina calcarata]XP_026671818.1 uncharacterized protein LOC108627608 isoform X3 [Ceratina calcarata]XP_026671819.1 uncharacterized protein LOC108627608 isoform X3 [Ceratina calcarata]XP_02667182
MSLFEISAVLLVALSTIAHARTDIGNWEACGGRLERALDALHRESSRRNRLEEQEAGTFYQQELRSAPLDMSVSRIAVKLPQGARDTGSPWARVEKCVYEPGNDSLRTRVTFNDLSVSGLISLMPRDHQPPIPAESCRMTLRLRRAGVDFLTSPIARGRGQMRIRTESSFLEPRFASIYAYGCHPTRSDKQIKRQDKWPPFYPPRDEYTVLPVTSDGRYEAAEPRQLAGISKEVDVVIPDESHQPRSFPSSSTAKLGIWRKNVWLTKNAPREKRDIVEFDVDSFLGSFENGREVDDRPARVARSPETISSQNLAIASTSKQANGNGTGNCTERHGQNGLNNVTNIVLGDSNNGEVKVNVKRDYPITENDAPREMRRLYVDETLDNVFPVDTDSDGRSWQSKEHIAKEMEDVFLRGASQALTRYIERQLHPAIKETLMISMGYTISYG